MIFKWLTAFVGEQCAMCFDPIKQGEGFYYEATQKKPHCRTCGRLVREKGYEAAQKERNYFMRLARGAGYIQP